MMLSYLFDETHARPRAIGLVACAAVIAVAAGSIFLSMHEPEPIVSGPGVTHVRALSHYTPALKGTAADTPVYILEGEEPGGTILLLGGTHAQEVSGMLAAVLMIENARPQQGRVIVIPQSNRSGFTHTDPMEGFPHTFEIDTPHGKRWFRNGMRLANPIHQWPDPDIYIHKSGEPLVGWEQRNLNRNFPGDENGRYTSRLAAAISDVALQEKADVVLDMHEAYPEYPIINMLVAHERAFEVATVAMIGLQMRDIPMDIMPSPPALRGLSHREFGDHSDALAVLSETANPAMGRLRGRTDETLIVSGQDENYIKAAALGRLFVPFDEAGHPLMERTGRQLATIEELLFAFNELHPDKPIQIDDIPPFERVVAEGMGAFLRAVPN